jgi:hypothetical protein
MGFFSGFFGKVLEGAAVLGASAVLGPEVGLAFGGIGSAAGGAIVGGVAGAGLAAATGQNVLEGGAFGAIGGYAAPGAADALTGASGATDITAADTAATATKGAQAAAAAGSGAAGQAVDLSTSDASSLLTSASVSDSVNATASTTTLSGAGSIAPSASAGSGGLSGFFSKVSPSSYLSAGASVLSAATSAYGSSQTAKATKDMGTPPAAPETNAADQLLVEEENDQLRTRRGLASNILTAPTGYSSGGRSAAQMLLS